MPDDVLPDPRGQPSEADIPQALRRGVVIAVAAASGAVASVLVAAAAWAVSRLGGQ